MQRVSKALVTGATGIVGRVLCDSLKAHGAQVCGLARRAADDLKDQLIVTDIANEPVPVDALSGVDTVFHAAEIRQRNPEGNSDEAEFNRVNVDGTRRVLEAANRAGVRRFVFISSVKAGGEGGGACLDEAMEDRPETPYGRTKLEAERLVFKYAREHKMHAVALRLTSLYGVYQHSELDRMLVSVAKRRHLPLPDFGDQRSMVHVKDVAEAAILAAEAPHANVQTYIVTDGRPYSARELYELVSIAFGRRKPRLRIPLSALKALARVGDILRRVRGRHVFFDASNIEKLSSSAWYSSRKIETELGFQPLYDLEKALPDMIDELGKRNSPGS